MGTFSEALSGLRSDVRELRREVREDVGELRDEMRNELTALRAEVGQLKTEKTQAKGWIAGALAVVSFLGTLAHWLVPCAVAALLVGCGETGPWNADAYWHEHARPVPVYIDEDMRPECVRSAFDAVDFWRAEGVDYLRPERKPRYWYGFGQEVRGAITITERTTALGQVGATGWGELVKRMRWARVWLSRDDRCTVATTAHELGHALGLRDIYDEGYRGYLMFWTTLPDQTEVTDFERFWVTQ